VDARQAPLHSHPGIDPDEHPKYENECTALEANVPDNAWLLFHPDAFNLSIEPFRCFTMGRSDTYRGFDSWGNVIVSNCLTARQLEKDELAEAETAIRDRSLQKMRYAGVDESIVTAHDLLGDQAILRYLPEFMAWLGHAASRRATVRISNEQSILVQDHLHEAEQPDVIQEAEKIRAAHEKKDVPEFKF
jgi:hypothetical protein